MMHQRTLVAVTCPVLIIFALFLTSCHLTKENRTDRLLESATERQDRSTTGLGMNLSEKNNYALVPQTGQKRSYAAGDDGNVRFGKVWSGPRFKDNGDGTVTDSLTSLMWTKNADKANGRIDWDNALAKCAACSDGGYTDWRLPNLKELESLVDLGSVEPALTAGYPFANVKSDYYWSSSTLAINDDNAWVVHFYVGFVTHDDKGGSHYIWYVRGGTQRD